jgi:hypothetical protein
VGRALLPALAAALTLLAGTAGAIPPADANRGGIGGWAGGFYTFHGVPGAPDGRLLPPEATCVDAILRQEREKGFQDHLLLAMGFTEAGRRTPEKLFTVWPWTVNTEGQSYFFASKAEGIAFVRETLARGVKSIDVGCLQVNLRWHPDAFPDLDTAFDPVANVRYAAGFLDDLRRERGDVHLAVARYHSAQSELGDAYHDRVIGNRRWVDGALAYLETLAAGPARAAPVWGKAELGRLSFLSSLYANAEAQPLLPKAVGN